MKYLPLISVITPSYNAAKVIKNTMKSVQMQTYDNWEMIIVDDCSKDDTVAIIKAEQQLDNRIKLIELKENSGAAVARNTAINYANGSFIAFLDSDDQWTEEKLEKQLQFMLEKDVAFSFTAYRLMDENGEVLQKVVNAPKVVNYNFLLKNTIIGCLTVMLNIEKLGKVQMPKIRTRQDLALWLSILKKGNNAYGLNEPLAYYRKVKGSISSNKMKMAKQNWLVYRQIEKLGFLRAAWSFANYAWNSVKKI
jgi:teichuronic acid biosynthesis glycosyltransferase TuaG